MIKVSIIVPVYNAEKYLEKCISSLVNQTLKDIEIILINDGSKDKSLEIIKEFQKNYSNIICINNTNHGIGYTRNCGIKKSKGKYLTFIDSDDYIEDNMIEKLYNFCEKNKLDIAVCDFYEVDDITKEKKIIKIDDFKISSVEENKDIICKINHSPWNKLYKRDLLIKNDITFPVNLKYEDMAFVISVIKYANKIGKFNEPLNYYIIHNNSQTTVMDKKVFDIFDILVIIYKHYTDDIYNEYLEYLTVQKLTTYTIQQRYQSDKNLRKKFINDAFNYLNNKFPNWKKSKYFKDRNILKSIIEKNKFITMIYCDLYHLLKK